MYPICMYVLALKMASVANTVLNHHWLAHSLAESMENFVHKFKSPKMSKMFLH